MSALDKFLSAHGEMRKFGLHYRGACLACNAEPDHPSRCFWPGF